MDSQLEEILTAFNRVLVEIGQNPLATNSEFIIDSQLATTFFLRYYSVPKSGRVSMSFELTSSGATFWIDKTREMPDISYKMIKENTKGFEGIIEMIFSSSIHAEYKGSKTVLSFINADSIMVGQYKFQYGILPSWFSRSTTKLYEPYFEV